MATLKQLQLEISNLEQSGATEVPMATVKALIQEVNTLFGQGSGGNSLFGELGQLAKYLNEMRKELYAMQQDDLAEVPYYQDLLEEMKQEVLSILTASRALGNEIKP